MLPYGTKDKVAELPIQVASCKIPVSARSAPSSPQVRSKTEFRIKGTEPRSAPGSPLVRIREAPKPQAKPKIVMPRKPWRPPPKKQWDSEYSDRPVWEAEPIEVPSRSKPKTPEPRLQPIKIESIKTPEPPMSPEPPVTPVQFYPRKSQEPPFSPPPVERAQIDNVRISSPTKSAPSSPHITVKSHARIDGLATKSEPNSPALIRSIRNATKGPKGPPKARQQQFNIMPNLVPVPLILDGGSEETSFPKITIRSKSRAEDRTDYENEEYPRFRSKSAMDYYRPDSPLSPTDPNFLSPDRGRKGPYRSPSPIPISVPIEKLRDVPLATPTGALRPTTPSLDKAMSKTLPIRLRRSKSTPDRRHLLFNFCLDAAIPTFLLSCMIL